MNFIHLFLAISLTLQTSKTSTPTKKHVFFQIDEFIKQLMTSEKFDKLTDLIANKAAEKITNMEMQGKTKLRNLEIKEKDQNSDENTNYERESVKEERSDEKSTYKIEKKKPKETKAVVASNHFRENNYDHRKSDDEKVYFSRDKIKEQDSRSKEKLSYGREKLKEKYSKSDEKLERHHRKEESSTHKLENIGKIDTQTFLKNQMASKELELNFKHLKGELEKHRFDVRGNNAKTFKSFVKKRFEHEDRAVDKADEKDSPENIKERLKAIDSKELLLSEGSGEGELHEQDTFHDPKKSTHNSDEMISSSNLIKKTFKYDQHSKEKPIPRNKVANNSDETTKSKSEEDTKSAYVKSVYTSRVDNSGEQNPSYSSKEVLVVGLSKARHSDSKSRKNLYPEKVLRDMYPNEPRRNLEKNHVELSTIRTLAEYSRNHGRTAKKPTSEFGNTNK